MTAKHQAGKKRGRPRKEICRALIPLDTKKICAEYLKVFKRRKKALEKLEVELLRYDENDEPEFQKFLARTFGAEQTRQRELAERIGLCHARHEKICFLAREHRMSKARYCYCLSVKVTPEIDFWSILEAELAAFLEADRKAREDEERREFEEDTQTDSNYLRFRIARGFCGGSMMTVTLRDSGEIDWGAATCDWTKPAPDQESVITLVRNLNDARKRYADSLQYEDMIPPPTPECRTNEFTSNGKTETVPEILCSAWCAPGGRKTAFFVNYATEEKSFRLNGKTITVPPLNVVAF